MAEDFMSDEDKALFREHMRTVKPLVEPKQIKTEIINQSAPISPRRKNPDPGQHRILPLKECYLSDFITKTVLSNTTLSYCRPGVPAKRFRELKNGQILWEGKLDMHGLTTEAARARLCEFIQTQKHQQKRCLLIVHGKGGHQGAPPVIKNLINRWLPQFDEVLAFHSALAKEGGDGAIYVLLKRNKGLDQGE